MKTAFVQDFPRLESNWESGDDFLLAVQETEGRVRFFHPVKGVSDLPSFGNPDATVSVVIAFRGTQTDFHIHARVIQRVTDAAKPGLLLEFLPEESMRQELVLACAQGEHVPYFRRQYQRVACRLSAKIWVGEAALECSTIDVSEGGVQVGLIDERVRSGDMVKVSISFPGATGRPAGKISGRIAFVSSNPRAPGVGIEFRFSSAEQRDEIRDAVRALPGFSHP